MPPDLTYAKMRERCGQSRAWGLVSPWHSAGRDSRPGACRAMSKASAQRRRGLARVQGYQRPAHAGLSLLINGGVIVKLGTVLALTIVASAPAIADGKTPSKRKPAVESSALVTPAKYRSEWLTIQNCEQFKRRLWLLPQADNLLQKAVSSGVAVKSEFESKLEFQERMKRELTPFMPADNVYLIHLLQGDWSRYDAERQTMTVEFPSYTRGGYLPIQFSIRSKTTRGSSYIGTNAFGVSKTIQRQTRVTTTVEYTFPAEITSQPIVFPMNGKDAELFKMGVGTMHILGRIIETNVRRGRSMPTLDRPNETTYTQYEVTVQPRCAYITYGPELIEGWNYDAW